MTSNTVHAIVIPADSEPLHEEYLERRDELKQLQTFVGGWIEAVEGANGSLTFWVNEEGKLNGLPFNARATSMWWQSWPEIAGLDVLCGDVVLTGGADSNGDTLSLPACFKPVTPDASHEWVLVRDPHRDRRVGIMCKECRYADNTLAARQPCKPRRPSWSDGG